MIGAEELLLIVLVVFSLGFIVLGAWLLLRTDPKDKTIKDLEKTIEKLKEKSSKQKERYRMTKKEKREMENFMLMYHRKRPEAQRQLRYNSYRNSNMLEY